MEKPISHSSLRDSCHIGFSGEIYRGIQWLGSEENVIIKQYLEKPKRGQFQSLLFSLIQQPVRINIPGAPLLGLAKSIYYSMIVRTLKMTSHPGNLPKSDRALVHDKRLTDRCLLFVGFSFYICPSLSTGANPIILFVWFASDVTPVMLVYRLGRP